MRHAGGELLDPYALFKRLGLGRGHVLVDFGSGGLGHFLFPAAELVGAQGKVYAVDVQRELLRLLEQEARQHQYMHVKTVWADVEDERGTGVPPRSADMSLMTNVLHTTYEYDRWAREAFRTTKSGGRALVVDWHAERVLPGLGPAPEACVDFSRVTAAFERAGWTVGERFFAGDHHQAICFHKPVEAQWHIESISQPIDL